MFDSRQVINYSSAPAVTVMACHVCLTGCLLCDAATRYVLCIRTLQMYSQMKTATAPAAVQKNKILCGRPLMLMQVCVLDTRRVTTWVLFCSFVQFFLSIILIKMREHSSITTISLIGKRNMSSQIIRQVVNKPSGQNSLFGRPTVSCTLRDYLAHFQFDLQIKMKWFGDLDKLLPCC